MTTEFKAIEIDDVPNNSHLDMKLMERRGRESSIEHVFNLFKNEQNLNEKTINNFCLSLENDGKTTVQLFYHKEVTDNSENASETLTVHLSVN